jgi:hypothetical protein
MLVGRELGDTEGRGSCSGSFTELCRFLLESDSPRLSWLLSDILVRASKLFILLTTALARMSWSFRGKKHLGPAVLLICVIPVRGSPSAIGTAGARQLKLPDDQE